MVRILFQGEFVQRNKAFYTLNQQLIDILYKTQYNVIVIKLERMVINMTKMNMTILYKNISDAMLIAEISVL